MNNDNSPNLLPRQMQGKEGFVNTSAIKNYNLNVERNEKPKFDLNLSDYFKLIEHKNPNTRAINKRNQNHAIHQKSDNNRSYKSLSNKSNKSNKSHKSYKSNKSIKKSKNSSKTKSKNSIDKVSKKSPKNNSRKIDNMCKISIEDNNLDKKNKEQKQDNKNGGQQQDNKNEEQKQNNEEKNDSKDLNLKKINGNDSQKIFNKRLNKQKSSKLKLPSTNNTTIKKTKIKTLLRNISCKKFNNSKIKKNYNLNEIKNTETEELTHDIGKYLVSANYYEKVKNNKYKYYNEKNNYYIETRRQRIEDQLNKIIYEKYRILKPLRMSERVFYIEENNKINNELNIANNLFYSDYNRKDEFFNNINKFLFNDSSNYNKHDKEITNNKNLNEYYKKVKKISETRRNLLTNDFFTRKDYSLLDFNFSFFKKGHKSKKNKS